MKLAGAVLTVTLAACSCGPAPDRQLAGLLDAEYRFASASETQGMKAAFLEFLDDESILFRPHPVDGRTYTEAQEASSILLSWEPYRARVSAAGDLGYTTGPYRIELGEGEFAYGYFVSVWRGGADREWRVVMDLGTENPVGESCTEAARFDVATGVAAAVDTEGQTRSLVELDRTLAIDAAREGLASALEPRLADDVRLYRDGRCPAEGKVAVGWALSDQEGSMTWEPIDAVVAGSGDLAYSYGRYTISPKFGDGDPLDRGYYVRVWCRTGTDPWKLLMDVTSPVPPDAEPPPNGEA